MSAAAKPGFVDRYFFDAPSQTSLDESLPGVPAVTGAAAAPSELQSSTLNNGLRVVTKDLNGGASTVGVFVKAGSRRDAATAPGTAHVLEQMAFKSTMQRSALKFQRDTENFGATFDAVATRETLQYTGTALRGEAERVVAALGEALTQPKMSDWEVAEEKAGPIAGRVADFASDAQTVVMEGLHAAAYGPTSGLGHGMYATPAGLGSIDASTLRAYLGNHFNASNMVVVGTNVDHGAMVDAFNLHFLDTPEGSIEAQEKATYAGGESHIRTDAGASYLALGFDAPSLNSGNVASLAVFQYLLNKAIGGVDFANAGAFASPYSDAGLVGVAGAMADADAGRFVEAAAAAMKALASGVDAEALTGAKASVKMAGLVATESPRSLATVIGESALLTGDASDSGVAAAVDAVTADSVAAVAKAALKSSPSVSAIGSMATLPRYDSLAGLFA
jgi:predicted Zn-dependent peptidase